ncbi:hypothetical protein Tco_1484343 [Tanacetum coccineum]
MKDEASAEVGSSDTPQVRSVNIDPWLRGKITSRKESINKEQGLFPRLRHSRDKEAQETVVLRIRDEGFRLHKEDSRHEHHQR